MRTDPAFTATAAAAYRGAATAAAAHRGAATAAAAHRGAATAAAAHPVTGTATCEFDWELQGVPPGMPTDVQFNMVFHADSGVVHDAEPFCTTPHTQGDLPVGVADALDILAHHALQSTQVKHMVVDFVDKHAAHGVQTPGTMTLTMDLSDMTRIGLPCEAELQLHM